MIFVKSFVIFVLQLYSAINVFFNEQCFGKWFTNHVSWVCRVWSNPQTDR